MVIFFVCSFLFGSLSNASLASGDYGVKAGQKARFAVDLLRNKQGGIPLFIIDNVQIQQGCTLEITFTSVTEYTFEYTIKTDLNYVVGDGPGYFKKIIAQNRNWAELTEFYENDGYNVTEDDSTYSFAYNQSGEVIDASYNKKTGILNRIYILNSSLLYEYTALYEIEFVRLSLSINYWKISFIYFIPITGVIIGLILLKLGKGKKSS